MKRLAYCAFILFAACSDGNSADVTDEEYDDIATSLASTNQPQGGGGEVGAMVDITVLARGGTIPGFTASGDGSWTGDHLGLAYSYDLECRDASDTVLALCGPLTDRAEGQVSWSGSLSLPLLDLEIERNGSWTIRDLASNEATVEGSGHMAYQSRFESPSRSAAVTYDLTYDAEYDALLISRGDEYPHGGSIHYTLDVDRTRVTDSGTDTRNFDVDALIEFSASSHAAITLDGDRHYDLNLETGVIVRVD